jgi:hypothetical protein
MKRRLVLHALFIAALFLSYSEALASGPGVGGRRVRLDNELAGPYLIRAVTSPTPPTINNFNVEVKVVSADTGLEVLEAGVVIRAEPIEIEVMSVEAIATHDFAPLPTEYAAHLPIPEVGLWLVSIQVEAEQGYGEVSFYQQISNPPNLGALVAIGAPLGGLLLLALVFAWLQNNNRVAQGPTR